MAKLGKSSESISRFRLSREISGNSSKMTMTMEAFAPDCISMSETESGKISFRIPESRRKRRGNRKTAGSRQER